MKIAIISEHASPLVTTLGGIDSGGQNVYVAQIAKRLAAYGCEVDVFTRRDNSFQDESIPVSKNLRVILVPAGKMQYVRKEKLLDLMPQFTEFLIAFFKENHYDLIHANYFLSGLASLELKRIYNIPFVITFHSLGKVRYAHLENTDEFPDQRIKIEKLIVEKADRIIALCPQDKTDLTELYKASPEKISIVPCGFDENEIYPLEEFKARKILRLAKDENIILQLGRLVPRKGMETVIRGVAELVNKRKFKAKVIIVGGETRIPDPQVTPEINRLQKIARDLDISKNVLFAGNRMRPELKVFYSAASVFASMPWYEPFGITLLEAMACAKPIIGSKVGGIKHTVVNNRTGFLVDPKNEFVFADKLEILLADKNLRAEFGQNGYRRVHHHFTWRQVEQQITEVYKKVLT